jgi:ankyrin repeat protein
MTNNDGILPLHRACQWNNLATVEYLYKLYPESISVGAGDQSYPIHYVIWGLQHNRSPETAIEVVQFLLDCNRDVVLQKLKGSKLPLYLVCEKATAVKDNTQKRDAYLKVLQILYDAYPEAIERVDAGKFCAEVQTFVNTHSTEKEFNEELRDFCRSESLSEDGLREIIGRYSNVDYHRSFILAACRNELVTERILQYLLEHFPKAVSFISKNGNTPLHMMCHNKNATLGMMQLLIDACPGSLRRASDSQGWMPLHVLCRNKNLDDLVALNILRSILEKCPGSESVRHTTKKGSLPLHFAAWKKTPEFCRLLIESYPGSERVADGKGLLPFTFACRYNTLSTVKYLLEVCPESINMADMPIHDLCGNKAIYEETALETLKLLLERCPESIRRADEDGDLAIHMACQGSKSPEFCRMLIEAYPGSIRMTNCEGALPFHLACRDNTLATVKYLYKLYPESISMADAYKICPIYCAVRGLKDRSNPSDGIEVIQFLLDDEPDALSASGETPLHIAFGDQNELVDLDIVQLLVDAFPDSLRNTDDVGSMPLHSLCANESIDEVVALEILKLLIEKCPQSVQHADVDGDLPIHIACQGSKSPEFYRMLIEAYPRSIRMTNCKGALPFYEACRHNNLTTLKYLYKLYPEGNVARTDGICPIHSAVWGLKDRSNPSDGIEVIQFLLDDNPDSLSYFGQMPLHIALGHQNELVDLDIVQLLIDAFPDSLRHVDKCRYTPIHFLCANEKINEESALEVLKLLIETTPESVRQTCTEGNLPIHLAAETQSLEFCRILIEAYPGSERMPNGSGSLPLHEACRHNTVATVEYLYKLYPESISVANDGGSHPIHTVIWGLDWREDNPEAAVEVVRFLLDCNPNVVLQKDEDDFPLYLVCDEAKNDNTPMLNAYLKVLQMLYDAYPEAIEEEEILFGFDNFCQEVQTFITTQFTYVDQAEDLTLMTTPDENGQLPLHVALRDNVTFGSIKLLVEGNSSALRHADNRGMIPLHVACQHHRSPSVVEYLIDQNSSSFQVTDRYQNTLLHFACRGANHVMIAFLLEKYDAAFVSRRNSHKQLPIDLLFDSEAVSDREGIEYMESIYRLIRTNPETVTGCIMNMVTGQQDQSDSRKKRKIDDL